MHDRYKNIINFLLSEKFITITVIGSIFTFAFISSMKNDIIEPIFHFMLPEENFGFMDITLRDGEQVQLPGPKKIDLKFGDFFREFVIWIFALCVLFLMAKYTRFPDDLLGNPGVAIM